MSEHAKLSASGSHRWINCPGSVKAEEGFPNTTNKYAEEGILAHEIAAIKFRNHPSNYEIHGHEEINKHVDAYVSYVQNILKDIHNELDKLPPTHFAPYEFFVEQKVDYSHIAHEGFGTADVII